MTAATFLSFPAHEIVVYQITNLGILRIVRCGVYEEGSENKGACQAERLG